MEKYKIQVDFTVLALVLLIIAFWGDPDLVGSAAHYLMSSGGECS